ncbi:MAG: DUF86 domain-containing protein [Candidatus Heimdallarchaeota archaeon]
MKREIRIFIEDIMESIVKIEEYARNIDRKKFFQESWIQDAAIRKLEIIGEAVEHIPEEFGARCPNIPRVQIAGIRDVLIHRYFRVNISRVWLVIEQDLPDLKTKISQILEEMD